MKRLYAVKDDMIGGFIIGCYCDGCFLLANVSICGRIHQGGCVFALYSFVGFLSLSLMSIRCHDCMQLIIPTQVLFFYVIQFETVC